MVTHHCLGRVFGIADWLRICIASGHETNHLHPMVQCLKPSGSAYIAAKTMYFGLSGGTYPFRWCLLQSWQKNSKSRCSCDCMRECSTPMKMLQTLHGDSLRVVSNSLLYFILCAAGSLWTRILGPSASRLPS